MAVVAVWKCDRDGAMFDNKKDAEEHDKMLELAANITALIERNVEGVSEEASEEIGLMLAKRREVLAKACKGKPEELLAAEEVSEQQEAETTEENVTPLAVNQ
ncbi:YebG family protein [Microbulbifer agarilyticus]|uniref:YebG family protein n=1 Tax=Microbulbifer agarilyticus TaxID=260552 RepID=UPI001C9584F4|nr:YebG family protein [Microbulbifer agarilyticus]MBY6189538.1 YebG family protein [Microbulbifer agarilyticus]MBY6210810.1 YebG family protein [Microbulbifer agarilyticus]MCA0892029.1 YebG family protein [Microbulbifer agarilyticus]